MIVPAAILLFLSIVLLWISSRQRKKAGLPGGKIVYTDTGAWGRVEKPLYYPALGLTGKPDYLVQHGDVMIPVEVKSGRTPSAPYDSHIYQVASYCLLVEKTTGKRPPYGIIHYPNRDFSIEYTRDLEDSLLDVLAEMRRDEKRKDVPRSHQSPARCRKCGYREICDQRL